MGNNLVIWAAVFLGIALILFFVELFIPSGGLIGFLAAASLATGIVMLFKIDTTLGLVGALVCLMGVPFLFALAIKVWPNTPIARMLLLKNPPRPGDEDAPAPVDHGGPIVGAAGKALTDLRPVGTCMIEGLRTECLAEGGVIRAGTAVRVASVDGMQIKVRAEI